MRVRAGILMGLVTFFGGSLAWGSQEGTRIQWDSREPWARTTGTECVCCQDEQQEIQFVATRGAFLPGRITTFALADTALYAFFLEEPGDLSTLAHVLSHPEGLSEWEDRFDNGDLTPLLDRPSYVERIEIEPNGGLTVLADEVLHPGMQVIAVVNSNGDILGSRLLWSDATTNLP